MISSTVFMEQLNNDSSAVELFRRAGGNEEK